VVNFLVRFREKTASMGAFSRSPGPLPTALPGRYPFKKEGRGDARPAVPKGDTPLKTFTAVALAAALISSQAQAAFQVGWNKLYFTNCLTLTRATIVPDVLWIFPDVTRTPGLTASDTFSTTDQIYVTQLAPFCISGSPVFVHFYQVSPALWNAISVYPGLK
jgi:hypothetical protein